MSQRRHIRLRPFAILAAAAALLVGYGCEEDTGDPEGLCHPNENIFCRCPDGSPATKPCTADGAGFGECSPCAERDTGAGGGDSGDSWEDTYEEEYGKPDPKQAQPFEACDDDDECQTKTCRNGYCTVPCTKVSDCPVPDAECIKGETETFCMPTCASAKNCAEYGAPESKCGYAVAVDHFDASVCSNWGDEHKLYPEGSECTPFNHGQCNLGYQGQQIVCSDKGVCTVGCYSSTDCPEGKTCSGSGSNPGSCG